MDDDNGPGWEMQQDNEARRRAEEDAALNRSRRLTVELRADTRQFEDEMQQLRNRINSRQEHANE